MFHRLLDIDEAKKHIDVSMPETVACCVNGRYFIGLLTPANSEEVIDEVLNYGQDVIVKPTVGTGHGAGVIKVRADELTRERVQNIIKEYGMNFTIQKVIVQHPD